jgi:four helix bundle protein
VNGRPHRCLAVWQRSAEPVTAIYSTTARFPAAERFGLISQMRRAALSIPSNIAEGAARKGSKEYTRFPFTARGSLGELDTQLDVASQLRFVEQQRNELQGKLDELSRMLNGSVRALKSDV